MAVKIEDYEREAPYHRYNRYTRVIKWSEEDKAWICSVPELPGCMTHDDHSPVEAAKKSGEAVEAWIEAAKNAGNPIPPPDEFK